MRTRGWWSGWGWWERPLQCGMCGVITVWVCTLVQAVTSVSDTRKPDTLFRNRTWLLDKLVTCGPRPPGDRVYPSETYSCYNIRVDGEPLRYHYLPSRGRRKLSTDCLDVPNNSTINYRNDFGALCNHLLRIHRVQRPLWAAIVSNVSCEVSTTERLIFAKTRGVYDWIPYPAGSGHVETLQCMLLDS